MAFTFYIYYQKYKLSLHIWSEAISVEIICYLPLLYYDVYRWPCLSRTEYCYCCHRFHLPHSGRKSQYVETDKTSLQMTCHIVHIWTLSQQHVSACGLSNWIGRQTFCRSSYTQKVFHQCGISCGLEAAKVGWSSFGRCHMYVSVCVLECALTRQACWHKLCRSVSIS